ncbi:hypothetical protein TREES_T100000940 [Tupaia chinensis]|uniref:Uncharacterized protein n=1 Tax=Tupaia chinensis TaxID=246437 RepID=L9JC71_TUPCH|nr:hypothetical protein TREES_T100000940 [Tupaia chinensis]
MSFSWSRLETLVASSHCPVSLVTSAAPLLPAGCHDGLSQEALRLSIRDDGEPCGKAHIHGRPGPTLHALVHVLIFQIEDGGRGENRLGAEPQGPIIHPQPPGAMLGEWEGGSSQPPPQDSQQQEGLRGVSADITYH